MPGRVAQAIHALDHRSRRRGLSEGDDDLLRGRRWNFGPMEPLIRLEDAMENEKAGQEKSQEKKPIVDQMTDLAAQAAGALTATAIRSVANRAKKAVAKRVPASVKKGARSVTQAPKKAPKRGAKKAPKRRVKKAAATKKTARKTSKGRSRKSTKRSKR